ARPSWARFCTTRPGSLPGLEERLAAADELVRLTDEKERAGDEDRVAGAGAGERRPERRTRLRNRFDGQATREALGHSLGVEPAPADARHDRASDVRTEDREHRGPRLVRHHREHERHA